MQSDLGATIQFSAPSCCATCTISPNERVNGGGKTNPNPASPEFHACWNLGDEQGDVFKNLLPNPPLAEAAESKQGAIILRFGLHLIKYLTN
jgi:hypothetical protein